MDTPEGNIIIAEYRGATVEQWYPENKLEKMSGRHVVYPKDHYPANEKHHHESMLLYHSDWNWLIPVVKKLLQELWDNPYRKHGDTSYNDLKNALNTLEINKIWEATIQGITVLNAIKNGTAK